MGTAGVAAKESPFANYYRWEEPYSDITVCLNIETANRLQSKLLGNTGSFPDAAFEIGGILLGRTEREAARTVIVIDDFDLVPCEHRQGPAYSLSENDLLQLRAALAQRKSGANRAHSVVGYYRSHNRGDLFLSADDLAVIQTCFPDQDNIFLLIKVLPGKACTAGFFFWNDGQIQSEFTDSEVALIPIEQPPELDPAPDEPSRDPDGLEELLAIRSRAPGQSQATGWRRRWVLVGSVISAIAAAALIAVVGNQEKGQAPRLESPRPVVVRNGTGSLPIPPAQPQARIQTLPESKGAIQQAPKIPVSKPADLKSGMSGQQKMDRPAVAGPHRGQQDQPVLASPGGISQPTADNEPVRPAASPAGNTSAAPIANSPGTTVTPPPIAAAPLVAESAPPPALDRQRPVSAVPQPPALTPPPAPPPTNSLPVETRFVGPQITHQVAPAIPLGIGPKIKTPVQIDVMVTIDESGKVIGARVTSSSGAAAGLLSIETLKAAHLFRFQPATENNRPVRSDKVLTFRFAPKD